MLHTDFFEFGASGQKKDRSATIESLTKEESVDYIVSDFSTHPVSQDVAPLTYATELKGKKAIRSSIWKKSGDTWRLFFHQGTKTE
ncbi:MAG: DUF4440 domain-containing protein [Alphaproteobacteria bacterium]|jgi:hypothetical protein